MAEQNKATETKTVWLVNDTKHPIHIGQPGKDPEGNHMDNIRLSTMGAVEVAEPVTQIRGVAYLIKKKSLRIVSSAEAKRLIRQHDKAIAQPDKDEEDDE